MLYHNLYVVCFDFGLPLGKPKAVVGGVRLSAVICAFAAGTQAFLPQLHRL